MYEILEDVKRERERQDRKWGVQNHSDEYWLAILAEEFGEVARAFLDKNPENLKEELLQVAAVAVVWLECIERHEVK